MDNGDPPVQFHGILQWNGRDQIRGIIVKGKGTTDSYGHIPLTIIPMTIPLLSDRWGPGAIFDAIAAVLLASVAVAPLLARRDPPSPKRLWRATNVCSLEHLSINGKNSASHDGIFFCNTITL